MLNSVLHVPNLDCNLLLVSKLSQELNYVAKFSSDLCEFQVLDLGKTIGSARMCSGLYFLKIDEPPRKKTHNAVCVESKSHPNKSLVSVEDSNKEGAIMLWHYRLGHPNFLYLQKPFPSLFINKNPKLFQCEVSIFKACS